MQGLVHIVGTHAMHWTVYATLFVVLLWLGRCTITRAADHPFHMISGCICALASAAHVCFLQGMDGNEQAKVYTAQSSLTLEDKAECMRCACRCLSKEPEHMVSLKPRRASRS